MSSSKIYRAAVVGCGRIGVTMEEDLKRIKPATHAGAFQNCPDTELAALVDTNPLQLKKASSLFPRVPLFQDAHEMLRKIQPDIVSVCSPPLQHPELVERSAEMGAKAILCEKPIATSLEAGERMIRTCKKNKTLLFVNHSRRFDPLLQKLRLEIQKKVLGVISQASCYYTAGLFNTGTHLIDLLRFLLGEVSWVIAFPNTTTSHPHGDINVDGVVKFKNKTTATIQTLEVNDYSIFDVHLYGSQGLVKITRFGFEIERYLVRDCADFQNYRELELQPSQRYGKSRSLMAPMVEHVVSCLNGQTSPVSSGEDGLAALEILTALRTSVEHGGKTMELNRETVSS